MEPSRMRPLRTPDFLRLHASGRPDAAALVEAGTGRSLSYRELDWSVAAAASMLHDFGVRRGGRVAMLARNSPEMLILQLACARLGAILAPLNWRLSPAELKILIEDCDPALLIGDAALEALGSVAVPVLTVAETADRIRRSNPLAFEPSDANLPSLMLYTSGTSGKPKGVLLSEANLFATAVNFTILGQVTAESAFLLDTPMFHVIGMVTNVRPALMTGGTVVISSGFEPEVTLSRLADPAFGITHYFCVPQMAEMLRTAPSFDPQRLSGLKALFTGGAPHPASKIREWLADGIPVVDGYGMTEAGTVLGMPLSIPMIDRKAGSAGLLAPTIERRLVRDDGSACEAGEVGELLLRGDNICGGYWRKPQETAKAFTHDGFLRTGDLAREDEEGFYYLVDRKKDMYISGGENVYPAEVEAVLKSHPDIAEAAVLGVADARWGEVGYAFLMLRPGASADEMSVRALCEGALARYKLPKKILFLDDMPRTGSGKIVKAELKKLFAARNDGGV
jgi:fatty-acyl-CoA synthase